MSPRKAKAQAEGKGITLTIEARKRTYECTYLTSLKADTAKVTADITASVKRYNGSVVSTEDWGKKDLAYTIKKAGERHTQANYTHMVLDMEAAQTPQFERDLYLNTGVLRHLIVIAEAVVAPVSPDEIKEVKSGNEEDEE